MTASDRSDHLPEVLQSVTMWLGRTTGPPMIAPARILDIESVPGGTRIVLSCPVGCDPKEHHFDATLTWTEESGRYSRSVITHPGRRPYGPVWLLSLTGPTVRAQDRRHFRARVSLPAQMTWHEQHPDAEPVEHQCAGVTVDLSEGGMLVFVRDGAPAVGTDVDTTVIVDGAELHSRATVIRHMPFPGGGGVGVGVMFPDAGGSNADRRRRLAFDAERRRVSRGVR